MPTTKTDIQLAPANVRFGGKADMPGAAFFLLMSRNID